MEEGRLGSGIKGGEWREEKRQRQMDMRDGKLQGVGDGRTGGEGG